MPISIEEVKKMPPMKGGRIASIKSIVLDFLQKKKQAYTPHEIQWELVPVVKDKKVGRNTVYLALTRLTQEGCIKKKKSYYWCEQ